MRKKRNFILMLVIAFVLQIAVPVNIAKAAGTDITGKFPFITNVSITDAKGNNLGNDISKSAEININYTWSIPNEQTVNTSDYYTMQLPAQIKIAAAFDQPIKTVDGNVVANMHVDKSGKATITFTDYASGHSDVHGGFTINCHFDPSQIGNLNPIEISFTIPGLGVPVSIPVDFQQPAPSIVKNGSYDPLTDEITWTLTVNNEGVQVNKASVEDIIGTGQILVDNSVLINGSAAILGTNYSYDTLSKKLIVNLGDITAKQVITFKTSVHADLAQKSQGTYNYNNSAAIKYEEKGTPKSINSNTASVPVTVKYITKDGSYNSSTKSIDWTIKVNESGRTIGNAVIDDNIPAGLTIDPASIKLNGASGNVYSGAGTGYSVSGQNFKYYLGNISSAQTITFSTKVDTNVYNSNAGKTYTNSVTLTGDNVPIGTNSGKGVGVPSNIIQKQGVGYDASKGIITWKITVNSNKAEVDAVAVVTDNIPLGQKYVSGSAYLDVNTKLNDSDVYTNDPDATKTGTFKYTFASAFSDTHTITFQTQVTDPKVYQANYGGSFNNTVNITATGINQNTSGSQSVNSEIIKKTGIGYNYVTREITWQVVINKNKMPITNAVITDDILSGQEYVEGSASINNGAPANGFSYTKITGDASKTGTLVYTFPAGNTINDAYTITFKTKVTDLSVFNTNGTKTLNNTASISGNEIPKDGNVKSTGTQNINNDVIKKTQSYIYGNAYIDWTVNVNSNFNIYMSKATITDTLQNGLSLNTDTVELYKAVVNTDGSLTQGAKATLTSDNVKYDPSTRKFDFTFPEDAGTEAYILKFTTDVAAAGKYSNTIEFKGSSIDQSSSASVNNVWFASGSAWGTGVSGSITVYKVDESNKKPLSGAVFELLDQYRNIKATSAPTGADGKIVFKSLKYDLNYYLKEITPPTGYELSSEEYTFQVHDNSTEKDIAYYYKDSKIKKDIQFSKKGEDGNPLKGAEFTLYENDGKTPVLDAQGKPVTAISDETGIVKFSNIEYGDYKIKETKAPEGYVLSSDVVSVSFSGDYTNAAATVSSNSVSNTKIRGNIEFNKIGEGGQPLKGAEFKLYKSTDTNFENAIDTAISDDKGLVQFKNVEYGSYNIKETNSPIGYNVSTDVISAVISVNNATVNPGDISNTKIRGNIEFYKTDEGKKPLEGAEFTLYADDGTSPIKDINGNNITAISDKDGKVTFNSIEYGTYKVKETKAPKGYIPSTVAVSAEFSGGYNVDTKKYDTIVTVAPASVANTKIRKNIVFNKTDEDKKPLAGAEFTLYDKDGINPITDDYGKDITAISEEDGTVTFENVEYGDYQIKETKAPKGYLVSSKVVSVSFSGDYTNAKPNLDIDSVSNTRIRGGVKITKTDENTKVPVSGAEVTVYNSDGTPVKDGASVTGQDGTVKFDNLPYGSYYYLETKAPEGYLLNTDKQPFTIVKDGVTVESSFSDAKIKGTIVIKKQDKENGKYLANAKFTLFKGDTREAVKIAVTNENGIAQFTEIEYGKYFVKETTPPEGYTLSNVELPVEINGVENGKSYDAGISKDDKIKGSVIIKKLDQDGKELKGAEFTLFNSEGKALQTAVSSEDGIADFKDLIYGNYTIRETKAPEGYIISKEDIKVFIQEDAHVYSYEVRNNKETKISFPKTGGFVDTTVLLVTGIGVIVVGAVLLFKRKKTNKNGQES